MAEFLVGEKLTGRIREVCAGGNVKCAVAYWGDHGLGNTTGWHIVCDIVSGSTSPAALEGLGAPENTNLKHVENLHTKVYISDLGMIVGSANASAGGLGNDSRPAGRLEAGVFCESSDSTWRQASVWFDELFTHAVQVGADELELAKLVYRPPVSHAALLGWKHDLLTEIMARPEWFTARSISFVFCADGVTQAEYENELEEVMDGDDNESINAYRNWPETGRFVSWRASDLDALRPYVVEVYLSPRGRNRLYRHKVNRVLRANDGTYGTFLTTRCPRAAVFRGGRFNLSQSSWTFVREIVFDRARSSFHDENDDFGVVMSAEDFADILRRNLLQHAV